jgi:hypothetical protein
MTTQIDIDPNAVYSDQSVTLLLGVTTASLREAERTGQLRHRRVGRRVLYTGAAILDWLNARQAQGAGRE